MKIFAHRYKVKHVKRRRVMKRALKDGKCKLIETNKDGWLYEISEENLKGLGKI